MVRHAAKVVIRNSLKISTKNQLRKSLPHINQKSGQRVYSLTKNVHFKNIEELFLSSFLVTLNQFESLTSSPNAVNGKPEKLRKKWKKKIKRKTIYPIRRWGNEMSAQTPGPVSNSRSERERDGGQGHRQQTWLPSKGWEVKGCPPCWGWAGLGDTPRTKVIISKMANDGGPRPSCGAENQARHTQKKVIYKDQHNVIITIMTDISNISIL